MSRYIIYTVDNKNVALFLVSSNMRFVLLLFMVVHWEGSVKQE